MIAQMVDESSLIESVSLKLVVIKYKLVMFGKSRAVGFGK